MSRIVACLLIVVFFFLVAMNILGAQSKPISLDVVPRTFFCNSWERLQARILVRIEPNEENRYLQVAYSSDVGESGSSLSELDGEKAPLSYTRYVWVNCNDYLFTACVMRTQGKTFCSKQEVHPP